MKTYSSFENPVLEAYRANVKAGVGNAYWLGVALEVSQYGNWTRSHARHGKKVLLRLARIQTPDLYAADPAKIWNGAVA